MITRRHFIKKSSLLFGGFMLGKKSIAENNGFTSSSLFMPDESHQHERTWMAFVANDYIWSKRQIPEVKRNLALIARTIAKYEPVSILVSPTDYEEATLLLDQSTQHFPIKLIEFETDDLWLRDTGPTFVTNDHGEKIAIDFNFNGWGNKQEHTRDSQVANFITKQSQTTLEKTDLVLEGGCFEIDGHGTAILTKSCVLNVNRNPHLTQHEIEQKLKSLLGLHKIIWLEGVKGKDITDGHTDFYARFTKPGKVVVSKDNYKASHDYKITRQNINILRSSSDANGNKLNLTIIDTPDVINETYGVNDFAAGYIGYYVCNGAVIAQKFGDRKADNQAKEILQKAFPNRVVEQISIDGIASGGGSIHCATQQEIKV
ncbi:MAG: agmatine deiminase family protein [Gammaproteobacteria bacterium]|nr:agmatine deiminase family protein [Gammaproteobacteria bacterium]